jgi:flagellar hook protein FlgE
MTSSFGLFNTSVMGMAAQSDALASISENIANSGTVGYKQATTHFMTVLSGLQTSDSFGGGVTTKSRYEITQQGALQHTSSPTDLGVKGAGFIVVSNSAGETFLTRAGSFVPDAQGRLVNAAGYYLMGFGVGSPSSSISAMQVVNINPGRLVANPSTSGVLSANLAANASTVPAVDLPSTNAATATFTSKTSLTTYDNLGNSVVVDIYFAKTGANAWEMTAYNSADAAPGGAFPYSTPALAVQTLAFSPANGSLSAGSPVNIAIPGGATLSLDISNMTQLGAPFGVSSTTVNGNGAAAVSSVQISSDGTLSYVLGNGQTIPAYMIALANVNSPDNLNVVTGNVFTPNTDSGQVFVGNPGAGGFGVIASSNLENSTVDLATQLSSMIVAQRSFTANSQVFQVASDILQVLNNIK